MKKGARPRSAVRKIRPAQPVEGAEEESGPAGVGKFFLAFGIVFAIIIGLSAWNSYKSDSLVEQNRYNGFDFAQAEGGIWVTRIEARGQPYDIPFYFHPREVEDIPVDPDAVLPLYRRPDEVYISINPAAPSKIVVAGVEIAKIAGTKYQLLNLNTRSALSLPSDAQVDIPVYSCANATPQRVIIQFIEGPSNAVAPWPKNPDCIVLQYTDANESVRVADRYAYMLLKIM